MDIPPQHMDSVEGISMSTLVGLCFGVAAFTIVSTTFGCVCYRRLKKKHGCEQPLTFQAHRRPVAIKSPASSTTHYLKKSPSPTSYCNPITNKTNGVQLASNTVDQCTLKYESTSRKEPFIPVHIPPKQDLKLTEDELSQVLQSAKSDNEDQDSNASTNLGELTFKFEYKREKNALVVSVLRCCNLPIKDSHSGSSDPYIKLQLLPEKQHKVKTRVLRKTQNPVYDEDFTFYGIDYNQLSTISLHFLILSFDRYSRDNIIGEVVYALNSINLKQNTVSENIVQAIQQHSVKVQLQTRGELLLSLCWQPAAKRLSIVILKARNLPKMDVTGLADPYVKIYLLYKNQRIAKKKTHVKKRTLNPVFNESFVFDIPCEQDELDNVSLEFCVSDWDRVTKNEVIGKLVMGGPKCSGSALHHWKEVCTSARRQIADWHKLQD